MKHRLGMLFVACLVSVSAEAAQPAGDDSDAVVQRLMDFELEDLARLPVTVTSVSKRPEALTQAASAIFVISSEDLRRAAITSVPEALRMVPGVHVAHLDANKWAITARGFSGEFANKLLVLIDGRSVYTPLFAGVYWDVQDLLIEDIDRIEVIRGPGATVWGVNAVNGVINIITRRADQTVGSMVSLHAGDEEQVLGARHGVAARPDLHWRAWARSRHVDEFASNAGGSAMDSWQLHRLGFRVDQGRDSSGWTVHGQVYDGHLDEINLLPSLFTPFSRSAAQDMSVSGGHLLARWYRTLGNGSQVNVQGYYDRTERDRPGVLSEDRDTFDLEFDQRIPVRGDDELAWGLGYRRTEDRISDSLHVQLRGEQRTVDISSAFLQYTWRRDDAHLSIGSKLSDNDYSGFEIQPSLRGSWSFGEGDVLWGAVSRAVRTPSRGERDARLDITVLPPMSPQAPPTVIQLTGSEAFDAEDLLAFEVGYRRDLAPRLAIDLAAFHNEYDKLIGLRAGEPRLETAPIPFVVQPLLFVNSGEATTRGMEASVDFIPTPNWRLLGGYSYLDIDIDDPVGESVAGLPSLELQSPRHQWFLRSHYNLAADWEVDAQLYHVDEVPAFAIGDYTRLDLRLGWRPRSHIQLSLGSKNLLDARHAEFGRSLFSLPSLSERSVYFQLVYESR